MTQEQADRGVELRLLGRVTERDKRRALIAVKNGNADNGSRQQIEDRSESRDLPTTIVNETSSNNDDPAQPCSPAGPGTHDNENNKRRHFLSPKNGSEVLRGSLNALNSDDDVGGTNSQHSLIGPRMSYQPSGRADQVRFI